MEIPSTEVQNNFGRYMKLARFEEIIVTKNGKKAVVIKPYEEPGKDTSVVAEKISYEDFLKLSEGSENRYEYIDGEVYLLASPSYTHQRIIMEISNSMYQWFKGKKCRPLTAPFDVTLSKEDHQNVVQPDIIVICDTDKIDEKGRYGGIPTLVVEVISETTQHKDMLKKLELYSRSGVREYWIVNPFNKEIYLYFLKNQAIQDYKVYKGNETLQSVIFKGLDISLDQVFTP
ncbi:prevent-host-death protein [Clostridiales bacterium PH28_bin88]|nr:prevent-host-death protein [Clostridiales bacterium PH28_bin88]